ncbi:MAG: Uma2 family endonuclease [Gammaproteobacteria bacterium]|nr:Uma2 family endonuclease [Gammaproteobacteria bacterium]
MSDPATSPEALAEEARLVAEFHEREQRSEAKYPSSDGQPMSENDFQGYAIRYFDAAVRLNWYADQPNAYVSSDLLIYAKEGDKAAVAAPDLFVVTGTRDLPRYSYRLWEEPKPPDFALEVASPSSWKRDLKEKKAIYESMGVKEYFACDPRADFYEPPLQGFRLEGGVYVPLVTKRRGSVWTLHSEVLGLTFRQFGKEVRLMDPATGKDLPTHEDLLRAQRSSAAKAEAEARRRRDAEGRVRAAEARVAELEALLAQ